MPNPTNDHWADILSASINSTMGDMFRRMNEEAYDFGGFNCRCTTVETTLEVPLMVDGVQVMLTEPSGREKKARPVGTLTVDQRAEQAKDSILCIFDVQVDPSLPADVVELRDRSGKTVARLTI